MYSVPAGAEHERAWEAQRRQLAEARTEAQHLLPFTLEEIQNKWADLERNVEELSGSVRQSSGEDNAVVAGALVRVALREMRRMDNQIASVQKGRSEALQADHADLGRTLSKLTSELLQGEAKVQSLRQQLTQNEVTGRLLASKLEKTHEEENPELALQRASTARVKEEEAQAAGRLARLEEDLAAAQAGLGSNRVDAEDQAEVAEREVSVAKAKARCEELLVDADKVGLELRAEMERNQHLAEEVTAAHQSFG